MRTNPNDKYVDCDIDQLDSKGLNLSVNNTNVHAETSDDYEAGIHDLESSQAHRSHNGKKSNGVSTGTNPNSPTFLKSTNNNFMIIEGEQQNLRMAANISG